MGGALQSGRIILMVMGHDVSFKEELRGMEL